MNLLKALFGGSGNTLSAKEAQTYIQEQKPLILDVRQRGEFEGGHIQGAKLIPLNELGGRLKELPQDREILCVCRSGARSGAAASQLRAAGYNVVNMRGGMISWESAGLPVKKGK